MSLFKENMDFQEDLILVQDERWRRGLGMQVVRLTFIDQANLVRSPKVGSGKRVSNTLEPTLYTGISHRKMV